MTNALLITLDQWRGDALSYAGHPVVRTPYLDRLAAAGTHFSRHYSQAAPCSPGRASLYTGMYQFNHRVVANGTPLDDRFDNVARAARRAGYAPALFGYTDQSVDPRVVHHPGDPRLIDYEGVLPGFDDILPLVRDLAPWREWLADLGHSNVPGTAAGTLASEPDRPAEHSLAAFTTERAIAWIRQQDRPWFAHLSYLRPHPPYAAAGRFAQLYRPDDVPEPISPADERHRLHEVLLCDPRVASPGDVELRHLTAAYFGMISEVDHQLGLLWDSLAEAGAWDDTFVIVTSDHGEQLGDHGLIEKAGFFEQSYHVPAIVRDPHRPAGHGRVVDAFTENVDVFPTLCDAVGIAVPAQCDGVPLTPFLDGSEPPWWRTAAHWEYDWRGELIGHGSHPWPWDRRLERQHLAVRRDASTAYVQFGDGSWRCFDLAADPTWRTETIELAAVLPAAQAMLTWRSCHTDRSLADALIDGGVVGRSPG